MSKETWKTLLLLLGAIVVAFAPMALIRAAKAEEPVCFKENDAYDLAIADAVGEGDAMWKQKQEEKTCGMIPWNVRVLFIGEKIGHYWINEVLVPDADNARMYELYDEMPHYIVQVVWRKKYAANFNYGNPYLKLVLSTRRTAWRDVQNVGANLASYGIKSSPSTGISSSVATAANVHIPER